MRKKLFIAEKAEYTMADRVAERWDRDADPTVLVITAATAVATDKVTAAIEPWLHEADVAGHCLS